MLMVSRRAVVEFKRHGKEWGWRRFGSQAAVRFVGSFRQCYCEVRRLGVADDTLLGRVSRSE